MSIADKTDTIVGFFGINVIPTGTADPYALRRQALGIINIILNKGYPIELPESWTAASPSWRRNSSACWKKRRRTSWSSS